MKKRKAENKNWKFVGFATQQSVAANAVRIGECGFVGTLIGQSVSRLTFRVRAHDILKAFTITQKLPKAQRYISECVCFESKRKVKRSYPVE